MNLRRMTRNALLTGVGLILFSVEMQLPALSPVPGLKLGLSNIVTVYALFTLTPGDGAMILAARILLGAMFSGNLSALMYSAAGGLMCFLWMLGLRHCLSRRQMWIASALGAVAHNLGQILVAMAVTRTPGLLAYLPVMTAGGVVAGVFTGLCAQYTAKYARKCASGT